MPCGLLTHSREIFGGDKQFVCIELHRTLFHHMILEQIYELLRHQSLLPTLSCLLLIATRIDIENIIGEILYGAFQGFLMVEVPFLLQPMLDVFQVS